MLSEFDRYFRDAKSPKEFLLIKLNENTKKDRRFIFKTKSPWRDKIFAETIPFTFSETEPGIFKVTPNINLEKGEYCFVHQDVLSYPNTKEFGFFDFSVE